jgi:hypothetical protein
MRSTILRILRGNPKYNPDDPDNRFTVRAVSIAMLFGTWVIIIVIRLIRLMIPATARRLGEHTVQAIMFGTVLAAGFFAHEFKKRDQYMYGGIEVCFGIGTAIVLVFSSSPFELHLSQWSGLVGAAYVIARGRSNIHDARQNPQASPLLRFIGRATAQPTVPGKLPGSRF